MGIRKITGDCLNVGLDNVDLIDKIVMKSFRASNSRFRRSTAGTEWITLKRTLRLWLLLEIRRK